MYYAGLDLGSRASYAYIIDGSGKCVSKATLVMDGRALTKVFEPYLEHGLFVAMEAGGSTRWVHDHLLAVGVREIHVVNPNRLRLIAESRRKTDKNDAKLLAELYRLDGLPEPVHMPSPKARQMRMLIKARTGLVEARTKLINTVRAFLRGQGVTLPAKGLASPANWKKTINNRKLDEAAVLVMSAYLDSFLSISDSIKNIEKEIKNRANQDERVGLLRSLPGIGLQSATSLVSAVDRIERFKHSKHLASYCGLTPSVRQSGERLISGHINRQGRSEVRRTFVQAAHVLANLQSHAARPLRKWFEQVRYRRGYKTAIVALARRLVTICYRLLRDMVEYDPARLRTSGVK